MPRDATKQTNPLLSKSIPPPPSATAAREETISEPEPVPLAKRQTRQPAREDSSLIYPDPAEEKATVEISLYLRPSQDDKLEDLKREYKRRKGKKISINQLIRLIIDRATLDDLL